MRQGRTTLALQVSLLLSASLLEVAANFAASDVQSAVVRTLVHFALPVVVLLLLVLIVGNLAVLRMERPSAERPAWSGERSPYPGLTAFDEQDAGAYFGRETQVVDLVRRLHGIDQGPAARFLCVTGASGSGKSSLIRAGLIPRLRARRWTILPVVNPADQPLAQLAAAFARDADDRATLTLKAGGPEFGAAAARAASRPRFGRTLLVLDQLEELAASADRDRFLSAVADALAADRRLWVVATLRVEFLPDLLASSRADLFAAPVALGALGPAELLRVVEGPAALVGLAFEAGLAARIVDDTASVDALPLLAYLLRELHLTAAGGFASRDAYQDLGGVDRDRLPRRDRTHLERRRRRDREGPAWTSRDAGECGVAAGLGVAGHRLAGPDGADLGCPRRRRRRSAVRLRRLRPRRGLVAGREVARGDLP